MNPEVQRRGAASPTLGPARVLFDPHLAERRLRLQLQGERALLGDLLDHVCIRQRVSAGGRFLDWTLRAGKERATLDVKGPLVLDDMRSALGGDTAKLRVFVDWFREKNEPIPRR